MRFRYPIAILATVLGLATPSRAADIFNTLPANRNGLAAITNANRYIAQSFSTTANDYVVSAVTLSLGINTLNPTGTYSVRIFGFNTSDNNPTTAIAGGTVYSGGGNALTTTAADVSFTGLNITLSPSTRYFMVVNSNLSETMNWSYTNNATSTGSTGYASQYYSSSSDGGSSWSTSGTSVDPQIMRVTAVPEPASIVMGGIATCTLAWLSRRRKQKARD